MDNYDIDLRSSGAGWMGTFYILVRTMMADILDDGPYGPVEVTLADETVITGTADAGFGDDTFVISVDGGIRRTVEIDDVLRVRL